MAAIPSVPEIDSAFTLDEALLAERRAASRRRVHTVQVPRIRAIGFAIVCVIAVLHDVGSDAPFPQPALLALLAFNIAYALLAWAALRIGYGRSGRVDLSLLLLHLDVLAWLPTLHHLEQTHLFFAYLLLIRVADQVGFGFRRAVYFAHVVVVAYLGYVLWLALTEPRVLQLADRLGIAAILYLLGLYLALTGRVIERMRDRLHQAVRAARLLVAGLGRQNEALQTQAEELEQARREAEQASVAKSQFLATISHELRTPMNGILGAVELLLESPLQPAQRRQAEAASRSAIALLTLIDDVLDLARIEGGRLRLEPTVVDLRALVGDAVEAIAAVARDKPVALTASLPDELPRVVADPLRLRQLLVNLLHNAIKFTEHGSVALQLSLRGHSADSVRLRFEVRDTGIGIAAEKIDSVFDAFTLGDASSTRRHGGSGVGLAIVKELADAMGGRVGVESRVGEGSVFWFEVELARAAEPPRQPAAAAPALAGRPAPSVLYADDDPVNQLVVQEMLQRLGCEVSLAADGVEAVAAAARRRHDVILMDLHMPAMDGYEATRRIREAERSRGGHTPIVALTADALPGDRERCLDAGMDDHLVKPVRIAQLAALLQRWLDAASGAAALPAAGPAATRTG